ncbi:hypothetical protein GY45DRAFT_771327 [Cubamyces sp. BRFM 1775]|nr:hypothetical protein GY45DRAFT_771327 [Cubamyces sp. BRFM 1775]
MSQSTAPAVHLAARALADAINTGIPYAVVGGAACSLLGSHRTTSDVDVVVPTNTVASSRKLLKQAGTFLVDPRTCHTYHSLTGVEIELVTQWFQNQFNESTPTLTVNGVRILHPVLILDAKCRSVFARSSDAKKISDAFDIAFLLEYCAKNRIIIKKGHVTEDGAGCLPAIEFLISERNIPRRLWNTVGYIDNVGWSQ